MRPLAIWAMQWALSRTKEMKNESKCDVKEDALYKYHDGYTRVARLLKVREEASSKSVFQLIFDYTCKRIV